MGRSLARRASEPTGGNIPSPTTPPARPAPWTWAASATRPERSLLGRLLGPGLHGRQRDEPARPLSGRVALQRQCRDGERVHHVRPDPAQPGFLPEQPESPGAQRGRRDAPPGQPGGAYRGGWRRTGTLSNPPSAQPAGVPPAAYFYVIGSPQHPSVSGATSRYGQFDRDVKQPVSLRRPVFEHHRHLLVRSDERPPAGAPTDHVPRGHLAGPDHREPVRRDPGRTARAQLPLEAPDLRQRRGSRFRHLPPPGRPSTTGSACGGRPIPSHRCRRPTRCAWSTPCGSPTSTGRPTQVIAGLTSIPSPTPGRCGQPNRANVNANTLFSAQRLQPYRGGHAVPMPNAPYPPGAGDHDAARSALRLLPSRSPVPSAITHREGPSASPIPRAPAARTHRTNYIFHTLGYNNDSAENWDYLVFNDRDFSSVAELLLVPGCPPGLFTKQFAEVAPSQMNAANIFAWSRRSCRQFSTLATEHPRRTPRPPRRLCRRSPPRRRCRSCRLAGDGLERCSRDDGHDAAARPAPCSPHVTGRSLIQPTTGDLPRPAPRLPLPGGQVLLLRGLDLLLSAEHGAPGPGIDDGPQPPVPIVGGPGGDGWFKMLEFFEVPSQMNGAIGPVAQGFNFDWRGRTPSRA